MMGCFHIACRYQDPNNARIVTIQGKFTWTCFYFHLTRPDFFHTQRQLWWNIHIYNLKRDFERTWLLYKQNGLVNIKHWQEKDQNHAPNQSGWLSWKWWLCVCEDLLAWLLDVDCSLTLNCLTSVTKPKECYFSSINSSLRFGHQTQLVWVPQEKQIIPRAPIVLSMRTIC